MCGWSAIVVVIAVVWLLLTSVNSYDGCHVALVVLFCWFVWLRLVSLRWLVVASLLLTCTISSR